MPAKNLYHDAVRAALEADGWAITADPHRLFFGGRRLYVDLAAERAALAAERAGERIAVEDQSFLRTSEVDDFHRAVGQYVVYRAILRRTDPGRKLFLAVSDEVYTGVMSEPLGALVRADADIHLIVFDRLTQRITRWTS